MQAVNPFENRYIDPKAKSLKILFQCTLSDSVLCTQAKASPSIEGKPETQVAPHRKQHRPAKPEPPLNQHRTVYRTPFVKSSFPFCVTWFRKLSEVKGLASLQTSGLKSGAWTSEFVRVQGKSAGTAHRGINGSSSLQEVQGTLCS